MPWTKIFSDQAEFNEALGGQGLRAITFAQAMAEAQAQLMEQHPEVLLMGEGVDDPGAIFGTTSGLVQRFGKDRVMDVPLAENGVTGVAAGAAMTGLRPIFVHMRTDFLPLCMDQIINHAAKWHYMTGGRVNVPLVVRSIIGRGWGSAAQHSQALHGLFMGVPGLKIIAPATPYDAKGLLIAASRDGNPVMCFEHRWTFDYTGYVPPEMYEVPLGQGLVRREGSDVTVVAISWMVNEAMKAASLAEDEGISVEVIDPRSLAPLDEDLIMESVRKTGRLIIADVACKTGGVGGEIVCRVAEKSPEALKAPVTRINFPDTPTPCSPVLESAYYPDSKDVHQAVRNLVSCVR